MLLAKRRRVCLLLFFISMLVGCSAAKKAVKPSPVSPPPVPEVKIVIRPGIISGKVTFKDEPIAGAFVYLYREFSAGFKGQPAYVSEESGIDGSFRLKVDPGFYYLIARKGKDFYCYYGGNPLNVLAGRELPVGLNVAEELEASSEQMISGMPEGTGIRGIIYHDGKPLRGAQVMVYLNGNSNFKGMGFDQRYTDKKGRFIFDLPEGTYYLLVRKRLSGQMAGPLVTGDYYGYFSRNPITVKDGQYFNVALSSVVKQDRLKVDKAGRTYITGQVVDEKGRAAAGVYVGAYLANKVMGKPDFVSKMTGENGVFELELPRGGRYFLMARNTYAGPPISGDLSGWYQGSDDHGVTVKDGEKITNIKITVTTMW